MKNRLSVTFFLVQILVVLVGFQSLALSAQDSGADLTSTIWAKAVLEVPGSPVTLKWKMVGADITPSNDQVISGYFYADPDDFAYGSIYNPEVFVKIYIATNGWCNIAFNHVTVDDVAVYSAHNYAGSADQVGTATLSGRLVEHTYTGVALDNTLHTTEETPITSSSEGYTLSSGLWAKAMLKSYTGTVDLIWKEVGKDTTPNGDKVISGYFYANPQDFPYGSQYNPEAFVKIFIATNGWCNIAFNHVTADDIVVSSAHYYKASADQFGTITLNDRLEEHLYSRVGNFSPENVNSVELIASHTTPDAAQNVFVSNDFAYVVYGTEDSSSGGLQILDVSDPKNPSLKGTYINKTNSPSQIFVSGNYAYIGYIKHGAFQIIDVYDPERPIEKGYLETNSFYAMTLVVSENYAYMTSDWSPLYIIDISDANNPSIVSSFEMDANLWALFLSGEYLYVGAARNDGKSDLSIVNVSDPLNPYTMGSCNFAGWPHSISLYGEYAFVTDPWSYLEIYNISNPASPESLDIYTDYNAANLCIFGNFGYINDSSLKIINVSDPKNIRLVTKYNLPANDTFLGSHEIFPYGNNVYFLDGNYQLLIFLVE